jgi:hypothetical protein
MTFLLLGGCDYFKGGKSAEEYIAEAKGQVPHGNVTTAILFVREMEHMPSRALLRAVLPTMLLTLLSWKAQNAAPLGELRSVAGALDSDHRFSGRLLFTTGPGTWEELHFGDRSRGLPAPAPAAAQRRPKKCKTVASLAEGPGSAAQREEGPASPRALPAAGRRMSRCRTLADVVPRAVTQALPDSMYTLDEVAVDDDSPRHMRLATDLETPRASVAPEAFIGIRWLLSWACDRA